MTDCTTGERPDAGTDQCVLATLDRVITRHQADRGTCGRADERAFRRAAHFLFPRIRIEGLASAEHNGNRHDRGCES
jgi:hypothetical protein